MLTKMFTVISMSGDSTCKEGPTLWKSDEIKDPYNMSWSYDPILSRMVRDGPRL